MTERETQAAKVAIPVVALAAALLATVAFLAWRIERRGRDVEAALNGIREDTFATFDLPKVNAALERMTRELEAMRTGGSS